MSAIQFVGGAIFSPDGRYRYVLSRTFSPLLGRVRRCMFIMLNPSTATAQVNDPTVRRCMGYATKWGYDELVVCNIFAYRSTDPQALRDVADPIGPANDGWLRLMASEVADDGGVVVCAWGAHGEYLDRGRRVRDMLRELAVPLHVLRVLKDGQPAHPLYLPQSLEPIEWRDA